MKKIILVAYALLMGSIMGGNAQVRIGGKSMSHGAAVLDLNANNDSVPADNKGALSLPRVNLASNTAILNETQPMNGMMVYNMRGTLSEGIYYWDGAKWVKTADAPSVAQTLSDTIAPLITWVPKQFDPNNGARRWNVQDLAPNNSDTCIVPVNWANLVVWDPTQSTGPQVVPVNGSIPWPAICRQPGGVPPYPCMETLRFEYGTRPPWCLPDTPCIGSHGKEGHSYDFTQTVFFWIPLVCWQK